MKKDINIRVLQEALYMMKTNDTMREVAKKFNVSKSTVHKDLSERLSELNTNAYQSISLIIDNHIKVRHIRGGESTRKKYLKTE